MCNIYTHYINNIIHMCIIIYVLRNIYMYIIILCVYYMCIYNSAFLYVLKQ